MQAQISLVAHQTFLIVRISLISAGNKSSLSIKQFTQLLHIWWIRRCQWKLNSKYFSIQNIDHITKRENHKMRCFSPPVSEHGANIVLTNYLRNYCNIIWIDVLHNAFVEQFNIFPFCCVGPWGCGLILNSYTQLPDFLSINLFPNFWVGDCEMD